jgi:acylphosphatase
MMSDADTKTVCVRISGRVQGVGYRAWAQKTARKLNLTGWVRNLTDGSVEAMARGPQAAVDALVTASESGPVSARVTSVETMELEYAEMSPDSFQQYPTAQADD